MKSITAGIKEEFKNLTPEEISAQIVLYQNDETEKAYRVFYFLRKKGGKVLSGSRENRESVPV